MKLRKFLALLPILALTACQGQTADFKKDQKEVPKDAETIVLGAGCFWCVESVYQQIPGVYSAVSGYMGGHVANPTYEQVCTATTGHAEVCKITYDPKKLPTAELLKWFWGMHDPTQANGQGADIGPQYRSVIFYNTAKQKNIAEQSKKVAQKSYKKPIVTSIEKEKTFYVADASHQDFYFLNRNNGYSRGVIAPKLEKLNLQK